MVTMKRDGKMRIEVRADDHQPAHFHITSPNSSFVVSLETLEVIRGEGEADELRRAVEWVRENLETVLTEWRKYHER